MNFNNFNPLEIATTIASVGESIHASMQKEREGGLQGHSYVFIDPKENRIEGVSKDSLPTDSHKASFKEISNLVKIALQSEKINSTVKVKMLSGYKEITQEYRHKMKQMGFIVYCLSYFIGQGKEVYKAEKMIDEEIKKYQMQATEGCTYTGNLKDGEGIIFYPDGKTMMEGAFLNGHLKSGKMYLKDGTKMEGEFDNNFLLKGVMTYPDGKLLDGEFEDAWQGKLKHGTMEIQSRLFYGDYENGQFIRGSLTNLENGTFCEGNFLNDELDGDNGKMILADKSVFTGQFSKGHLHGKGQASLADGRKIIGEFQNGLNGKGIITFPNGDVYEGEFYNAKPQGVGTLKKKNGEKLTGQFAQGEYDKEYNKLYYQWP